MTTSKPIVSIDNETLVNYLKNLHIAGPYPPALRETPINLWISQAEAVKEFVAKNKLESSTTQVSLNYAVNKDVSIRGGIRVPHLHYNGEIYLLNKEQWNEFSGKIIKDFSKKLAESKNVNFSQLVELSETMSEIN